MYKKLKYELVGVGKGLMMGNSRMANPFDPLAIAHNKVQSKRAKDRTDADEVERQRLLFMGSFYLKGDKPGIPEDVLIPTIARGNPRDEMAGKLNTKYRLNLRCCRDFFPIEYKGSKTPEGLWEEKEKFACTRLCKGILKTSVIFPEWKVVIEIEYNDKELDGKDVDNALVKAGKEGHLMAWRRGGWGKFKVGRAKTNNVV